VNGWRSALRVAAITAACWLFLTLIGGFVRTLPGWPHGIIALGFGLASELLIGLYQYESRNLGRKRARQLVGLRLAALGLLGWILIEPTWVRSVKRKIDRQIAVLWDESASMDLTDDGQTKSRKLIAREALEKSGILAKLGDQLRVREIPFARSPETEGKASAGGWNMATDIAAALDGTLEQIPTDELAGAIVLTDGRHNRPSRVEESARRFGILDAPLGIVAVGSAAPPKDASILSVRSPDAIHLGDRMRVTTELKFDGYKDETAKVRLSRAGQLIEERTLTIPADSHREEVKFTHLPEEGGTEGYQIEIGALAGERFPNNNQWSFETSITEARTNVLLADNSPRWEFRYLRNLFYGRDKSVHLQWLLLHPDAVEGQAREEVAASASRPFGQAAATRFPENEAEWRKFDVIILGDLPPDAVSESTWAIISRCVNERGALLVFIAGPESMPHALESQVARDLLPLDPGWSRRTLFGENNGPWRFSLTSEGRRHAVTQTGNGSATADADWALFPAFTWRHPVVSVKEGAEILLTASDNATGLANEEAPRDVGSAIEDLARHREREAKQALLVTRQTGHGKVAALMTDRTWRLREGAGDTHHHQFWGNLVRWGAGPLLRSGNDRTALGTDQLTYTPDDPVVVTARLRDADLNPLSDESLRAEITRDGRQVATVPLAPVAGSNGLHEGKAAPMSEPGIYQIRISGKTTGGNDAPTTRFRVVGSRGPVELADTTMDLPLLESAATASGGKVVKADDAAGLLPLFLSQETNRMEVRETPLWDNALVFGALALILTAEWWLRRSSGLP